MHFALMVFGPSNDEELERALAPFNEQLDHEVFTPCSPEELASAASWADVDVVSLTPAQVGDYYASPGDGRVEDGVLGYMSTYDPDGKWDWWQVGGRYAGRLKVKDGVTVPNLKFGWEWDNTPADERPGPDRTDRCQIKDLDIEGLRLEVATKAAEEWDRFALFTAIHGPIMVWDPDRHNEPGFREAYHSQPALEAFREEFGGWALPTKELVEMSREEYIVDRASQAWSAYSLYVHGEGWFEADANYEMSHADREAAQRRLVRRMNMLLENLDPETWVTIVDYHS
jgi:hypothetical protein